jgi:hypothetical protein
MPNCLLAVLIWTIGFPFIGTVVSGERPDFNPILGEWVRTDGDYTIHVLDIKPDGLVYAGYFNPVKINISEAKISEWKGLVKLFVKLQDKGYPGSTYTLYYYPEKDALVGFYYQAEIGKTFEVVFFRKFTR